MGEFTGSGGLLHIIAGIKATRTGSPCTQRPCLRVLCLLVLPSVTTGVGVSLWFVCSTLAQGTPERCHEPVSLILFDTINFLFKKYSLTWIKLLRLSCSSVWHLDTGVGRSLCVPWRGRESLSSDSFGCWVIFIAYLGAACQRK